MTFGAHEPPRQHENAPAVSNQKFGFVVGGACMVIAVVRAWLAGGFGLASFVIAFVSVGLIGAAWLRPDALSALNRVWMQLGAALHRVTNPILLGAIFVLAIIPTGFFMRLFGVDTLRLRSPQRESYWIARSKRWSTARSLERPF